MPAAYIIYTYIHITHIHTQRTRRNISIYNIYTIYIRTGSGELLEGKTASAVTIVTPLVLNPISVRSVLSPKLPVVPLLLHQPTHPSDQTTPVHRMPPETPFCLLPRRTPSGGARYATTSSPPNHQPVYIFYFTFFFFLYTSSSLEMITSSFLHPLSSAWLFSIIFFPTFFLFTREPAGLAAMSFTDSLYFVIFLTSAGCPGFWNNQFYGRGVEKKREIKKKNKKYVHTNVRVHVYNIGF